MEKQEQSEDGDLTKKFCWSTQVQKCNIKLTGLKVKALPAASQGSETNSHRN